MKKTMFIAALLLASYSMQAQTEVYLGARGGLNIPKLTASGDNPMSKGYSSRLAGNGGIFAEFRFTELFSLQPMIEYTQQGGKRNGMQAIPVAMMSNAMGNAEAMLSPVLQANGVDLLYADFKSETKFDNIMVPVLAKFGWNLKNTPIRLYVDAGPFISFLLKAKQVTKGSSELYINSTGAESSKLGNVPVDQTGTTLNQMLVAMGGSALGTVDMTNDRTITDDVYRINYGVSANVGLLYEVAPRHNLLFEVGGNYSFRKMQKSTDHGQNRIGAATIVLGYAYKLK